jgi:hypothetical protein
VLNKEAPACSDVRENIGEGFVALLRPHLRELPPVLAAVEQGAIALRCEIGAPLGGGFDVARQVRANLHTVFCIRSFARHESALGRRRRLSVRLRP